MAIDTAPKRKSAMNVSWTTRFLGTVGGGVTRSDVFTTQRIYSGFAAGGNVGSFGPDKGGPMMSLGLGF